MRLFAILMIAAAVAGLLAMRRGYGPSGPRRAARASDDPPRVLQVLWPVLVALVVFSPFLAAIAPGVATSALGNVTFPFDMAVQIAGFLLWTAGGLLVARSARVLGRFMVTEIVVSTDHELIQTGPYAYVRHPAYAGAIVMAVGIAFLFLSVAFATLALAVVLLAAYRARKEERLLGSPEGFGEAYRAYMACTGRFLPRLRK